MNVLPETLWAKIASDYLSLSDVHNCICASGFFFRNVPPLVHRLFVTSPCCCHLLLLLDSDDDDDNHHANKQQLLPIFQRYSAIQEIYIYTLFQDFRYSHAISQRIIPFLRQISGCKTTVSQGSTLKRVFVGGPIQYDSSSSFCIPKREPPGEGIKREVIVLGRPFLPGYVVNEIDAIESFRSLVDSFCTAFERSLLPNNLTLMGILENNTTNTAVNQIRCRGRLPCRLCPRICQTFPVHHVGQHLSKYPLGQACLSNKERLCILANRPGGKEYLRQHPSSILLSFLLQLEDMFRLQGFYSSFRQQDPQQQQEAPILSYPGDVLDSIQCVLEDHLGDCDLLSKEAFWKDLKSRWFGSLFDIMVASSFAFASPNTRYSWKDQKDDADNGLQ